MYAPDDESRARNVTDLAVDLHVVDEDDPLLAASGELITQADAVDLDPVNPSGVNRGMPL